MNEEELKKEQEKRAKEQQKSESSSEETQSASEETQSNSKETESASKEIVSKDLKGSYQSFKNFISELLDIREDTDRDSTIEAVKKDISFKGHNAWILVFSIFIASIGLNVNSTAVVIGAMLISPLMGPIVGVGLSVAINDVDTLRRSLVNLAVMVVLSVLTAFFYFSLSPLTESNVELDARTYPTILDVLVAIFGGLALIVAKTKKGTIASVIFGVAIATALMPPLCTVGFELAEGSWTKAGGALYLFSINATFIALSTFVVAKLLGFPLVRYVNSKRRRRISQAASVVAIIVMVPSIYLFYNLLKESYFKQDVNTFIKDELQVYQGSFLQKNSVVYDYNGGLDPKIEVSFLGKEIPNSVINLWREKMKRYDNLKSTSLIILQNENTESYDQLQYMHEFKKRDSVNLLNKDERIVYLETELKKYGKLDKQQIPFVQISEEAKINYENLKDFAYASKMVSNFEKIDTIPVFNITWNDSITTDAKQKEEMKLQKWLQYKLKLDTLVLSVSQ